MRDAPSCWLCRNKAETFYTIDRATMRVVRVQWDKHFPNGMRAAKIPDTLMCADCTDTLAESA